MVVRALAALLTLLIPSVLSVPLTLRRGELPTPVPGTIHDFLFKQQPDSLDKALDSDKSDYDLLRLLFSYAGAESLLLTAGADNGFTLFAPTDEALTQSARDIRELFQLNDTAIPGVEDTAWTVFQAWFDTMPDPQPFVSRILKYHIIVDGEFTLNDLQELDDPKLNTSSGDVILFSGSSLNNGDDRFENPQLIMDCHFTMDDGVMHPIDRLAFPDPNGLTTDTDHVPPFEKASPSAVPPLPEEQSAGSSATPATSTDDNKDDESEQGAPTSSSTATTSSTAASAEGEGDAACFPSSATVHLADGSTLKMSELSAGHSILSSTLSSQSSRVYLFSHREHEGLHDFVRITTSTHDITLTPGHYLYANGRKTAAERVKLGDRVDTIDGESIVISITKVREKGLFAPHTLHGDLIVNGIRASSYTTAVSPRLAHMLLSPLRLLVRAGLAVEPLGGLLYNGSPRLAAILPSGNGVY